MFLLINPRGQTRQQERAVHVRGSSKCVNSHYCCSCSYRRCCIIIVLVVIIKLFRPGRMFVCAEWRRSHDPLFSARPLDRPASTDCITSANFLPSASSHQVFHSPPLHASASLYENHLCSRSSFLNRGPDRRSRQLPSTPYQLGRGKAW
jgi:hypothetical protein